jgi:hypothetical protein
MSIGTLLETHGMLPGVVRYRPLAGGAQDQADACGVTLFAATNPTAVTIAKTASNVLTCITKYNEITIYK